MTQAQKNEMETIRKAMANHDDEYVLEHWNRYLELWDIEQEEYRARNQESFDEFYREHIQGRRWEDIDQDDWDLYSDWHKDMYGFRPRFIG